MMFFCCDPTLSCPQYWLASIRAYSATTPSDWHLSALIAHAHPHLSEITEAHLSKLPARASAKELITDMLNYPRYGTVSKHGSRCV